MEYIIIRSLHFISILILFAALVAEHLLFDKQITKEQLKKLAVIDMIYGIFAVVALITGLLLWFLVGKPAEFYNTNAFLHIKLTLFVIIAALSIIPTLFLLKNRQSEETVFDVPPKVIMLIRIELTLLLILPILAVIMAKGGI